MSKAHHKESTSIQHSGVLEEIVEMTADEIKRFFRQYRDVKRTHRKMEDCFDEELLASVRKSLWGIDSEVDSWIEEVRENAEVQREKAARLDEWTDVPFNWCELRTLTDSSVTSEDIAEWQRVYESLSVEELLDSAVIIQAKEGYENPEEYRILKGFVFYKTGDASHLVDIFNLDNRGRGLSVEEQRDGLANVLDQITPVIGGLLCGWVYNVTTNETVGSSDYGTAKEDGRWLNLISDTEAGGVSTIAHEFGHAVQYAFGISCDSDIDNRDYDVTAAKDFSVEVDEEKPFSSFQEEMQYLWEQYQSSSIEEVRSYQEKNFNEFFACAFEYWATSKFVKSQDDMGSVYVPTPYEAFFNKHLTECCL